MTSTSSRIPYGASPPNSWQVVPLKRISELSNGFVFKSDSRKETGTPILRIENLNGSINFNRSSLALDDRYKVTPGDLLFSWSGNPGTSFGPYRWSREGIHYLNQHIFKVSVHGCDKNWLYWALRAATHWIERELTSGMIGMVHVTKEELGNVPIPIPSLEEQHRIANFLNAETARIDAVSAKRRQMKNLLALKRNRIIDAELGFDGRVSIHGLTPLKYLVEEITVGIVITPAKWYVETGGVPAIRGLNVQPGQIITEDLAHISEEGHTVNRKSRLRTGDVVIVRTGQAGAAAVVPDFLDGANCIDLILVRPGGDLSPAYLEYVLNSDYASECVSENTVGSIQAHFNVGAMKKLPVPPLSRSQQDVVVKSLNRKVDTIDQLLGKFKAQEALLTERRQALITAAVTGQIDVSTASGRGIEE